MQSCLPALQDQVLHHLQHLPGARVRVRPPCLPVCAYIDTLDVVWCAVQNMQTGDCNMQGCGILQFS